MRRCVDSCVKQNGVTHTVVVSMSVITHTSFTVDNSFDLIHLDNLRLSKTKIVPIQSELTLTKVYTHKNFSKNFYEKEMKIATNVGGRSFLPIDGASRRLQRLV